MATNNFSAQDVVLDLLRYIGVVGFSDPDNDQALNQPGLDDDDIRRAIGAVNSALQTIQKHGPQRLKEGQGSAYFPDSSTLTVSATKGSKSVTATTTPPAASKGCSVSIDGDGDINRIVAIDTNTITLLRPYMGSTLTGLTATILYDCASLDADVQTIIEPVYLNGKIRLHELTDMEKWDRVWARSWCWPWSGGYPVNLQSVIDQVGNPGTYMTERQRDGTVFLRIWPMSAGQASVTFNAKLRAERITADTAIDTEGGDDPGYYFTSLHDDEVESVLLPIARWRFLSHPSYKNNDNAARIEKEYQEVMGSLKNGEIFETSVRRIRGQYI